MIEVDFHTHSLYSGCGLHTVMEMLTGAKEKGLKGIAIADHGPALGGRVSSVFFDRLTQPLSGIRLLKGMECNVMLEPGKIDCPMQFLKWMDVVLLGLHLGEHCNQTRKACTDLLIRALEDNPYVDIVTHPNSTMFPVDYERLAVAAAKQGMALELNNSKSELRQISAEETEQLVKACMNVGCRIAVDSDAHVLPEIGRDHAVLPFLERARFPEELIVNRKAETAFAFVEERRDRKQKRT